jgi:hypothetical protein
LAVAAMLATTIGLVSVSGVPVAGQGWTPPRTPWGDPDLQGDYTNKYEQGTPFERPEDLAGRQLEDITGAELTALVRARAEQVLLNSPFSGGDPVAGNFGGAPVFYDRFEAGKGSRLWFVVDPPDGQIPPMSPEGARASAARAAARAALRTGRGPADSHEDRSLYDRCITRGLPGSMMPTNYGNSYRIVQGPGFVAITYEMVHETRVIPLGDRPRLGPAIRQYMGDARGRWEGHTLVVETTNLLEAYRGANPETVRYVERFTPVAPDRLEWSFTVDDPSTWTRPWTFAMPLTRNGDEAIFEYACHEGNRAMANLLTGARAEEAGIGTAGTGAAPAPGTDVALETIRLDATETRSPIAGVWTLERTDGAGGRAFAGYSTAPWLVIRHRDADVTVETNTGTLNQRQAAVYRLDGSENVVPGPLGWDTRATAAFADGRLVVSITRVIEGGAEGPITFEIRDVYRVTGETLTLERSQGGQTRTMTYRNVRP